MTTLPTTPSSQVSVPPLSLPSQVATAEEALAVIQSLRAHFDLVGTEFTADDAASQVETIMSETDAEFASLLTPALTRAVQEDSRWNRLRDTLAECGNETIGDVVSEIVGDLSSAPLGEDQVYVIVATTKHGHLIREATVQMPEHVAAEVARARSAPGADEVRVGIRTAGEDGDLHLV